MMLPAGLGYLPRLAVWASMTFRAGWGGAGKALSALSQHTGIPVVVLAAVGLVISFRVARRASRLALEFAVALVVLVTATRMGWIRF